MIRILTGQRDGLNVCHINAQSLLNKMDEFRHMFEESRMDVVCVSETWFDRDLPDSFVTANGYRILRNDRRGFAGGVAIFLRNGIHYKEVRRSADNELVEYLFIEIFGTRGKLLLGCVYRPHSDILYENFMCDIELLATLYNDVIIAGDFNCNILSNSGLSDRLVSIGLNIVNTDHPTHFTSTSSTLLDIFILADESQLLLFDQLSAPTFSKHDLIFISYDFKFMRTESMVSFRDFRNCNFSLMYEAFDAIDWNAIYYMLSAEEQLSFFNSNLLRLCEISVPLRTYRGKKKGRCWFNSNIRRQIYVRDELYKRWKRFRTTELHEEYRNSRRNVNKAIADAKAKYYSNCFRSAVDSKRKWQKIREIGIGNRTTHACNVDVDELNNSFVNTPSVVPGYSNPNVSVGTSMDILRQQGSLHLFHQFEFSCVLQHEVSSCCLAVSSNAVGFDQIHPQLVKLLLPRLLIYITHIFNTIITTGNFPCCWKHARVVPVPKTANEYRPISILPYLSKVFERLLHVQLSKYLNNHQLLVRNQSGFRAEHSCVTSLINVSEDIRYELDNGRVTFLVLLDHSKAFDSVNHGMLCTKLSEKFNFSSTATLLLATYLTDRYQSVSVGSKTSTALRVTKGVPQGSILGPLLFTLYINDLPSNLTYSNVHIYADDVQLYISCRKNSIHECIAKLNMDLERTYLWAVLNGLCLNPRKSKCLLITPRNHTIVVDTPVLLGNQSISFVDSAKNLGIIFNSTLRWNTHINSVSGIIFSMLRVLYSTQHLTPLNIRELLAKTFLMPKLLYGCEIFAFCDSYSKSRLTVAYNAILRYVYSVKRYDGTSRYSKSLYGVDLADLLKIRSLLLLHRIIYTKQPPYLFERLNFARSNRGRNIIQFRFRSLISEWQFFTNSIRLWNSLPNELQTISNAWQFRKRLFLKFQS